jgi:hypothetical protein
MVRQPLLPSPASFRIEDRLNACHFGWRGLPVGGDRPKKPLFVVAILVYDYMTMPACMLRHVDRIALA